MLARQGRTHMQRPPVDSSTWAHASWPTSKFLQTSALCGHWIQSRGPTKRDDRKGQMERKNQGNPSISVQVDAADDDDEEEDDDLAF